MVTYARGAYTEIYIDVIAGTIRVRLILFNAVSFSLLCRESLRLLLLVASLLDMHVLMMPGRESILSSLHFGTRNHAQTQDSDQYSDQHNTTFGFEDGTPDGPLEESKPATEGV